MKLVIVESPAKTKTIKKFLGEDYQVAATLGHIRDLPQKRIGVDLRDFTPEYAILPGKNKTVNRLKKLREESKEIILATDLDREGEAIAYHVKEVLGLDKYKRIVFNEITKNAIQKALQNPRKIDDNLVNSQKARRILDRIVGYKLSPLLWKKIARGLSAGRVQSVALRLICDREKEIKNFKPKEYWTISADFQKSTKEKFEAELVKIGETKLSRFSIEKKEEAQSIAKDLKDCDFSVIAVQKKQKKASPYPPFTTSTLQQEAWYKLGFSSKQTMFLAQSLYEKGLITYHRTDSLNLSSSAVSEARALIQKNFGKKYLPSAPNRFKTKTKGAQEAHEAIRPAYPKQEPDKINKLNKKQKGLYDLIWKRFVASQMSPAQFNQVSADIKGKKYVFQARGQTLFFDGFAKVYPIQHKEAIIPNLKTGEKVRLGKINPKQHFTQPPARYNEASIIKEMKKNGIGRPSTYAPTISIILKRGYVNKEQKKFYPTDLGEAVNSLLINNFPKIFDVKFTANMEENLDEIAQGKRKWKKVLADFYEPFEKNLEEKYGQIKKKVEKTRKKCPECGSFLVIRMGRFGKFYGCSAFPKCKYTAPIQNKMNISCPKCKKGKITEKKSRKGKVFYGCDRWPDCDFALWDKPTGKKCPECNSLLVQDKKGKIKCSNKDCSFIEKK